MLILGLKIQHTAQSDFWEVDLNVPYIRLIYPQPQLYKVLKIVCKVRCKPCWQHFWGGASECTANEYVMFALKMVPCCEFISHTLLPDCPSTLIVIGPYIHNSKLPICVYVDLSCIAIAIFCFVLSNNEYVLFLLHLELLLGYFLTFSQVWKKSM